RRRSGCSNGWVRPVMIFKGPFGGTRSGFHVYQRAASIVLAIQERRYVLTFPVDRMVRGVLKLATILRMKLVLPLIAVGLWPVWLSAADTVAVYTDSLAPGWENWSWNTTADVNEAGTVHGAGGHSIAVTYN